MTATRTITDMANLIAAYLVLKSGPDLITGLPLGPRLMAGAALLACCAAEGTVAGRWLARRGA